jgi:hypothetical protein
MKRLYWAVVGSVVLMVVFGLAPTAEATSGSVQLQRLAVAQTQLLFDYYHGAPQAISPERCNQGQGENGDDGVFLLPANSFGSGNRTLGCVSRTKSVLLDLGGGVATEDARGDTYELADGTLLTYTRANLQAICNDAIRYFTGVPATLDGQPISGTSVITRNFLVKVNPDASAPGLPYYQDSIDLGHPGRLAGCYTGTKALLRVAPGRHVITVDLSGLTGAPTTFTYIIKVECR